ncbi:MAG: hypothetical protein HY650_07855 [Acidobacteria bacterium]|nr:hypothetical protein [Acidobacteriota bacterium]
MKGRSESGNCHRGDWSARALLASVLCLLSFTSLAISQSGRRQPKTDNAPPIQPPAEFEAPGRLQSDKPAKPAFTLLLAQAPQGGMVSSMYTRTITQSCAERLQRSKHIEVISAPTEMNRKEASEKAKSDPKTYVALIDFELDNMGGTDMMSNNPGDIVVNYMVYAPGTGKAVSTGRVYQRYRNVLPVPGGRSGSWYSLEQAGQETAERILGAVGTAEPPPDALEEHP